MKVSEGLANGIEIEVDRIIEKGEWENWENIKLDLIKFGLDAFQQGIADCAGIIKIAGGKE